MNSYFLGLVTIIFWAIYNVFARYVGLEGAHPVVFVCYGFIVASLVLLIIAGPGKFSLEAFRSPVTWLYGVFALFEHIFTVYLFIYVTSAEGSLLQRFGVILSVALAWIFFNRKPSLPTLGGLGMIMVGCYMLIENLDIEHIKNAVAFLIAAILFQVLKTMVIEAHPQIMAMRKIKDKMRVTAIISFVSSMIIFVTLAGVASYGYLLGFDVSPLPTSYDFLHGDTLILGAIFGILIEPVSVYSYFYAVRALNSERFMALAALVPLVTYVIEGAASGFTEIPQRVFSSTEWACLIIITLGSTLLQVKSLKRIKKGFV